MVKYWSIGLVGSDVLYVLWISWYMGLCSPMYCSEISCLCCWYYWIYSCQNGNNSEILFTCFIKVMVSLIGPYSCLLFKVRSAYADWDSLCLMCSWYLCFKLGLFVQYMKFGLYYTWVYKCRSSPVPEYYWWRLVLWVVVEYYYSWRIFLY